MISIEVTETKDYVDLTDLMDHHDFIGYSDCSSNRYMVVTCGSARGLAVNPTGTASSQHRQNQYTQGYTVFDTKSELLEWMKG